MLLKSTDILAAIQLRIDEYERITNVATGDPVADQHYNKALNMVIADLREILTDGVHAVRHNIPVVRCLHVRH